ncbi:MAG: alpha/beta fold hydrolase [Promethearchaeota archaeon]
MKIDDNIHNRRRDTSFLDCLQNIFGIVRIAITGGVVDFVRRKTRNLPKLNFDEIFSVNPAIKVQLATHIESLVHPYPRMLPDFWDPTISKIYQIPVEGGTIRVIHYRPPVMMSKRPVVLVPGWGVTLEGFRDTFEVFYNYIEFYYVETREKKSSRIPRYGTSFDMTTNAQDVAKVIKYFKISQRDFVLMGTCWGGAVVLHGLIHRILNAPTCVVVDPMHKLEYPRWVLAIAPVIPVWFLWLLKPLLTFIKLRNHKLPTQRKRIKHFIKNAVLWKWKKTAHQVRRFELFGQVSSIPDEVFIFNATTDNIHDQRNYPQIAREMPHGRFIYMPVDEQHRERLIGHIGSEFALINVQSGCPNGLTLYEKKLEINHEIPRNLSQTH